LIGLGVGIDYALFIVTRHRNAVRAGTPIEDAAVNAINTSGRAVLFAGLTVAIALLGQFAIGLSFLDGAAVAATVTVVATMLASLTLLPSLLGFIGPRVLSRKQRRRVRESGPQADTAASGIWHRWSRSIERRSALRALVALAVVVVVALPVFSLRLGLDDAGTDPTSSLTRQGYDLLARGFGPGFNGPLELVATLHGPADQAAFAQVVNAASRQPGVVAVTSPKVSPSGNAAVAIVVVLAFILLMLVFRSLVIPAMASVVNLLSVGAALGVMNAVFNWGWGSSALGLSGGAPVEVFLPVIMFSVLFGLSTDYEVFLVSRIREEWDRTGDNRAAVTNGQALTGKVITAAATIMILVFLSFLLNSVVIIQQFGVGLAAAIIIDAFVVRTVLVPALMHLSGRANWWLPRWLDRLLPHLAVDVPDAPPSARSVPARDVSGARPPVRRPASSIRRPASREPQKETQPWSS